MPARSRATTALGEREKPAARRRSKTATRLEGELLTHRPTGMGVGTKFALAISLTLAAMMALIGLVLYNIFSGALNQEIDESGVLYARVLAVTDASCWFHYHGTSLEGREEEVQKPRFTPLEAARYRANRERLAPLAQMEEGNLVDAFILTADKKSVLRSMHAGGERVEFHPSETRKSIGDTRIAYGWYVLDDVRHRGRFFEHPVLDPAGEVSAHAGVVLSEARIAGKLGELLVTILLLAFLLMGIGVGVSYFMSRRITAPIRDLIEDIEVISRGDLDHRTVVHTSDEIGMLARTFDKMTRNLKVAHEAEIEHKARIHEVQLATEVQKNLIPTTVPAIEGFDVAGFYKPSHEVGGDYYDFIESEDHVLGIVVGHAPVSGIPGSMVITMARSIIRAEARHGRPAIETLKVANRLLARDIRRGMYVDTVFATLDGRAREITLVNAGQNRILVFKRAPAKVHRVHAEGLSMGFDRGPVFDERIEEVRLALQEGDRVVFATAGVLALRNRKGEEFGEARLGGLMKREAGSGAEFVATLSQAVDQFLDGAPQTGDLTVVIVTAESGSSS